MIEASFRAFKWWFLVVAFCWFTKMKYLFWKKRRVNLHVKRKKNREKIWNTRTFGRRQLTRQNKFDEIYGETRKKCRENIYFDKSICMQRIRRRPNTIPSISIILQLFNSHSNQNTSNRKKLAFLNWTYRLTKQMPFKNIKYFMRLKIQLNFIWYITYVCSLQKW